MSQSPSPTTQVFYPALSYRDAPAAIEWLERAFGFETTMNTPGPDGTIAHAELSFGGGIIMLGTAVDNRGKRTSGGVHPVNKGIYVYVKDPDAHYTRAKAAGAEIERELNDTDYGSREYSARDPERHVWSFGTYRP